MKKSILSLILLVVAPVLYSQTIPKREEIKASQVPKSVMENHDNTIGFPAEKWVKLTINDQPRYVAIVSQMNPSSGKTLKHHYRYNENGKATSNTEYRGNGKGEEKDFFISYLGTGPEDTSFQDKIAKLLKENTLISFEGFGFTPGNLDQYIATHRFVIKDKSGKKVMLYFDSNGKEVDISKYPLRLIESMEMD